jgi:hypothetical protein
MAAIQPAQGHARVYQAQDELPDSLPPSLSYLLGRCAVLSLRKAFRTGKQSLSAFR